MKRIFKSIITVCICLTLCACADNTESNSDKKFVDQTVIEENIKDLNKYSLNEYMLPYWSSDVIYNESVMPLLNEDGTMDPIELMYDIDRIVSVKSTFLNRTFEPHKDYIVTDGKLLLLTDGQIPFVEYLVMYPDAKLAAISGGAVQPHKTKGYMYFAEGSTFHSMQLAVTYIPKGKWDGPVPEKKADLLPKTMAKLKSGEDLKITLYGDSISVGANSSKFVNAPPYCENYFQMLVDSLEDKFDSNIRLINPSEGGKTSGWGVDNAENLVANQKPDLAIIAFGMNDGSKGTNAVSFKQNIKKIMDIIKDKNPECEFILVCTMKQNDSWPFAAVQELYVEPLKSLEGRGCAVADVTSVHKYLLGKKRYMDMTGNHVNHPNDFIVRLYAQIIFEIFN